MRTGNSIFTARERKTAVLALLMAALAAIVGMSIDHMMRPSVGPYGSGAFAYAPVANVLDAQPIGGV